MAEPEASVPLILMNDVALALPPDLAGPVTGARLVVAGTSNVRLTLPALALPDVTMIWTDFGQNASLIALQARVRALGRLDRMILAGDGKSSAETFAIMQTIITFLPILKLGRDRGIVVVVRQGPAVAALTQFLHRLRPSFDRCGISLALRVTKDALAPGHAVGCAPIHHLALH